MRTEQDLEFDIHHGWFTEGGDSQVSFLASLYWLIGSMSHISRYDVHMHDMM